MTTPKLSPAPDTGRHYLIALLGLLSPILGAVAAVVPSPWSWCCAVAAVLAAGGAGLVVKVPAFLVGRPIVSPTLAGAFVTAAGVLVTQSMDAPEGWARALLLAPALALSGAAGVPLPAPGASAAARVGAALLLFLLPLGSTGCSTVGPRKAGLVEVLAPQAPEAVAAAGEQLEEPKASPFSVGPMLGVVVPFDGTAARPAQLLVGSARVNGSEGRAVNVLAFGGFAAESFGKLDAGDIAGGLGASVELTPGDLLYSVDLGGGIIFTSGAAAPAGVVGITFGAKL